MPDEYNNTGINPAARQEFEATVKFLAKLHEDMTGKPPTPEELIEVLRERGQRDHADELERLVAKVRAKRKEQGPSGPERGSGT